MINWKTTHYLVLFDLKSMQNATEKCHYADQFGGQLTLVLNFDFPTKMLLKSIFCENVWLQLRLSNLTLMEKLTTETCPSSKEFIVAATPIFPYRVIVQFQNTLQLFLLDFCHYIYRIQQKAR